MHHTCYVLYYVVCIMYCVEYIIYTIYHTLHIPRLGLVPDLCLGPGPGTRLGLDLGLAWPGPKIGPGLGMAWSWPGPALWPGTCSLLPLLLLTAFFVFLLFFSYSLLLLLIDCLLPRSIPHDLLLVPCRSLHIIHYFAYLGASKSSVAVVCFALARTSGASARSARACVSGRRAPVADSRTFCITSVELTVQSIFFWMFVCVRFLSVCVGLQIGLAWSWSGPALGRGLGAGLGRRFGPGPGHCLGPGPRPRLGPGPGPRLGPGLGPHLVLGLGQAPCARSGPSLAWYDWI